MITDNELQRLVKAYPELKALWEAKVYKHTYIHNKKVQRLLLDITNLIIRLEQELNCDRNTSNK